MEDLCRCSRTCKRLQTLCENQFRREYRSEEMLLIIEIDGTLRLRTRYYECVKYFNNFVNRLKISFVHHNCEEQRSKGSGLDLSPVTNFMKMKCKENLLRFAIIGNVDLVLLCSEVEKLLCNVEIVQIIFRSRHERNEAEFLKFFPNVTTLHLCRSFYITNANAKENVDAILEHKYDQLTTFQFVSCDALSLNDEKLKIFFQANDKIESLALSFDLHIDVDHPPMDRNDCTVKFFQTLDYATNLQYFYLSVDVPLTKSFGDIRNYLDILCDRKNFKTLVIAFLFQPGSNFLKSHVADLAKWKQLTKIHLYCIPLNDVLPSLRSLVHLKELVLHHPCLRYHSFHLNTNTDAIAEQNIVLPQVEEIQIEESCYDHDVDYHVEQFVGHWMNLKRLLMPGCRKTFAIAELNRTRENLANACELKLFTDNKHNATNWDYKLVKLECVRFEEDCESAFQTYCKALRK